MGGEFKNKTVVITGVARGIGESIAIRFAKASANLVIADYADEITSTAIRNYHNALYNNSFLIML
ncbi:hypothetical protein GCM10023078_11350 [Gibbsiella greigii]